MFNNFTYYWEKIVAQIKNIDGGQEPTPSLVPVPVGPPDLVGEIASMVEEEFARFLK